MVFMAFSAAWSSGWALTSLLVAFFIKRFGVRLPWVAIRSKAGPISPSKGICASICTGMPGEGALHGAEDKRLGAGVQTENTAHQQRGFM